jgi:hypothetical protein
MPSDAGILSNSQKLPEFRPILEFATDTLKPGFNLFSKQQDIQLGQHPDRAAEQRRPVGEHTTENSGFHPVQPVGRSRVKCELFRRLRSATVVLRPPGSASQGWSRIAFDAEGFISNPS